MERLITIVVDQGLYFDTNIIIDRIKNSSYEIVTAAIPIKDKIFEYQLHGIERVDEDKLKVIWQHSFQIPCVHEVISINTANDKCYDIIFFQPSSIDCLKQLIDCSKEITFVYQNDTDPSRLYKYISGLKNDKLRMIHFNSSSSVINLGNLRDIFDMYRS